MQTSRRWRDWTPPEKFQEYSEHELTKPTKPPDEPFLSVLSVATLPKSEINTPSASIPPHDLAEWREPFARWLGSACVRSPRCSGGVSCLHTAFCEWEIMRGGVPCTYDTFERLLRELGFLVGEVAGVVLVAGVTFREDLKTAG